VCARRRPATGGRRGRPQKRAPHTGSGRGRPAGDRPPTGAFSTLLRQSGLRASTGGVLATKSERKMLASTCLYPLYAWLLLPSPRRLCFRCCLFVCLLATLRKNFRTDLHDMFCEGWQWISEQLFKFWWRSGSPSGYRDCFPDSILLGDRESLTALQLWHHYVTGPRYRETGKRGLGGGLHCPDASHAVKVLL